MAVVATILVHCASSMYWVFLYLIDYIAAHFKITDSSSSRSKLLITLSVWTGFQIFFSLVGMRISKSLGPRFLLSVSMLLFGMTHFMMAFTISADFFMAVYGCLCGISVGLASLSSFVLLWSYFPTKIALTSGIVMVCHFASVIPLTYLGENLMNPTLSDDYEKEKSQLEKFKTYFLILAAIFVGFTFLLGVFTPPTPSYTVQVNEQAPEPSTDSEHWEDQGREKMLREFGTIVDGRAKIINQDIGEMKISGLDDLFASPVKPGHRHIETRSLTMNLSPLRPSPLIVSKVPIEEKEDKFSRSATIPSKEPLLENDKAQENAMASQKDKLRGSRTKMPPRTVGEMLCSLVFWQLTVATVMSSLFSYYILMIWQKYFESQYKLSVEDQSKIWKIAISVGALYSAISSLIASKWSPKWVYLFTCLITAGGCIGLVSSIDSNERAIIFVGLCAVSASSVTTLVASLSHRIFSAISSRLGSVMLLLILQMALFVASILAQTDADDTKIKVLAIMTGAAAVFLLCIKD